MAAHHVLLDGLKALDGSIPVLSEEDCEVPLAERAGWTRWWLVDPLDGTKEFIAGSAEFTVNVALIEQGEVRFGVVGIPAARISAPGAVSPMARRSPCACASTPREPSPSSPVGGTAARRRSSC